MPIFLALQWKSLSPTLGGCGGIGIGLADRRVVGESVPNQTSQNLGNRFGTLSHTTRNDGQLCEVTESNLKYFSIPFLMVATTEESFESGYLIPNLLPRPCEV